MDVDRRDWGRPSLVDYVPFLGLLYRFYWWRVASAADDPRWRRARRRELYRATVPVSVTAAAAAVGVAGGDAVGYAVILLVSGMMLYRTVDLLSI